jgi:hypothetical protein
MKTGCIWTARGEGRIAICHWLPQHLARLPRDLRLAPEAKWIKGTNRAAFLRYYGGVLGALDPEQVWNDLHALVAPHEPILLCWERLAVPGETCHRTLAASWFREKLGQEVEELPIVPRPPKRQLQLL